MNARDAFLSWTELLKKLVLCDGLIKAGDLEGLKASVSDLVREFVPEQENVDWIHVERQAKAVNA